ncbi:hypothetical protein QUA79_21900 [Microcoleus sp. F8-D1]
MPLQRWFIRVSALTKPSWGRKRYTAVDTFGLVLWRSQQQVFLKVKRANRFSRRSTRCDKGFHGCIRAGSSASFAIKFRRRSPVCLLAASLKVY